MRPYQSNLLARLTASGWQSWSTGKPRKVQLPLFNYPPFAASQPDAISLKRNISLKTPVKGWCSWYCFGKNIDQQRILRQAEWFHDNPLPGFEYILVDDGWASRWGDWKQADSRKFPDGLRYLSQQIQQQGMKPGIWVAPFLVSPRSRLAREHPEWLVSERGRPLEGIRLTPLDRYWPYRKYVLDVTQPAVMDYVSGSLRFLLDECGFQLIKLDFLYALYNNPKLTTEASDKILRDFLLMIHQRYPSVYTIACGCPLVPAVGTVDAMRIGPDMLWPFAQPIPVANKILNRRCYRQVVHNIGSRAWTKQFWNVDCDAFVCREGTGLSDWQLHALARLIRQAEGDIFLGDDMTALPQERLRTFIQPLLSGNR